MKNTSKIFLSFLFSILALNKFYCQEVRVLMTVDTSNIHTKNILELWTSYRTDLFNNTFFSQNNDLSKYWLDSDILNYERFDFYRELITIDFTYLFNYCYFLGVVQRDSNLFEFKVNFFTNNSLEKDIACPDYFSSAIATYVVKFTDDGYKLSNKLNLKKKYLRVYNSKYIMYYYDEGYPFSKELADNTEKKIEQLCYDFNLIYDNTKKIEYFISDNLTNMYRMLGFDYHFFDFLSIDGFGGTQISSNKMIFYGGENSEGYMHEIFHILFREIRSDITWFEEGVCCYYGDHLGKPFEYYIPALRNYLDRSMELNISPIELFNVKSSSFNHAYILMALLVKIAEHRGGPQYVKQMLKEFPKDNDDVFNFIYSQLDIQEDDFWKTLLKFLM